MKRLFVLSLLVWMIPLSSFAATYTFDAAHSNATFTVRHLMITNVKGSIPDISGTVIFDESQPNQAQFNAKLAVASIDTRNKDRDDHLRSADFFHVEKHPFMTFESTEVKRLGPSLYMVSGNLTMSGVTKPVVLNVEGMDQEVKDPWGNVKRGARFTTEIDRRDFGMTWNKAIETGGVVVGHEVKIEVEVQLVKQ